MSEISYDYRLSLEDNISKEDILNETKNYLHRNFNKVKFEENSLENVFSSRVKSKILNPVVSLEGKIEIKVKERKSKVFINVDTKLNGWFWFEIILGLFFPIIWILLGIQWWTQKKKSSEIFSNLNNHLNSRFSTF